MLQHYSTDEISLMNGFSSRLVIALKKTLSRCAGTENPIQFLHILFTPDGRKN